MIRVKIAARDRRVLMASHTLEKVQLDAGVSHPGQRRVSRSGERGARKRAPVKLRSGKRPGSAEGSALGRPSRGRRHW